MFFCTQCAVTCGYLWKRVVSVIVVVLRNSFYYEKLLVQVVECACVVEIKGLNAAKKFEENGHSDVPIWALMDEV